MYDICIVGAGVVGMNIARELSRYRLKICVLEKADDVSCGCSKANSGIVHGGYSDEPGTLKAQLCVTGNRMYEELDRQLNFGYRRTGSMLLALSEEDIPVLNKLYEQGVRNGVSGLSIIGRDQALAKEPYLNKDIKAALYCESAGVTSPYEFVIALAENAVENGVVLRLNTEVTAIKPTADNFVISTSNGEVMTKYVINAAGIYSDTVSNMVGISDYRVTPRRGQYILLDKDQSYLVKSIIFQAPSKMGKGILVTTTFHGNLMVGPNAEEIYDKNDVGTDIKSLEHTVAAARRSVPGFDMKKALTSFAGNRPVANIKDFIIEESKVKRFINLIGIDSPGLTASPAIALKVVEIIRQSGLVMEENSMFKPYRKPIIRKKPADFAGSPDSPDPQTRLICRCESVTEAEIIDSLQRGIPIASIDAIKRRTRAGMGKCQGAFCGPRIRRLIVDQLGVPADSIALSSKELERAKRMDFMKL